jgi:lysophospholipase L1-like esterase
VDSHAALIEKATGKPVTVYNDAVVGAKSSDLSAQVQTVISQTPDYVTFLIGGNDFCAASRTDPVTFNNNISQALATLSSALPDTKIFVSSLPNPITLWSVNHENAQAQQTWAYANICPSLFSNPTDVSAAGNTRRQAVYDEAVSYNSILQLNCAKYINCHFDNNTVFNIKFSADEISNSDFFHPSKKGQELLAEKTWTDGGVKTFLLG